MDQGCTDEVDGPLCYTTAERLKKASSTDIPLEANDSWLENVQGKTTVERLNGFHKTDVPEKSSDSGTNGICHKSAVMSSQDLKAPLVCGAACGTSTRAPEPIVRVARELMIVTIEKMTNRMTKSLRSSHASKHAETMLRTVEELSKKHEIFFKSMVEKLEITKDNGDVVFVKVVDEIFADRRYNWGRVVTVYAFAGWLARYCAENAMEGYVDCIADTAGEYVAERLAPWMAKNGGWDAFDQFFEKEDSSEKLIWRGLLYTIFGLGVGAAAAVIAVR